MEKTLLIYNIFPPLTGHISNWNEHLDRAVYMGFNTIYINPINYPGFSGSLYAVKDYYSYNPDFFSSTEQETAEGELIDFSKKCAEKGLTLMCDLVINHSASDSPLTEERDWHKRDEEGKLVHPGAWDDGEWVCWGDLAEFDNKKPLRELEEDENAKPDYGLWNYWKELIRHYVEDLGIYGFRCDAAYQIPAKLWEELISYAKGLNASCVFFAETLGCPLEDSVALAKAGFDYISSSSRWWDFTMDWCTQQYNETREYAPSVSFPENHDTMRAITEYKGNINRLKQYALFTAIFTKGWMTTIGYEWGFKQRCKVVGGNTDDMEPIHYDITDYIKRLLEYKSSNPLFVDETEVSLLECFEKEEDDAGNEHEHEPGENSENEDDDEEREYVRAYIKKGNSESMLVLINSDCEEGHSYSIERLNELNKTDIKLKKDISFEEIIPSDKLSDEVMLAPGELKCFLI